MNLNRTVKNPRGIVIKVPDDIMLQFKERKQQIHMGELLAPFCAFAHWPDLLKDASTINYIDNMGVLCNIVNGAASELDAGTLVFALHLRMTMLNTSCWWDWVESEFNCSDGGSRVGVCCPLAKMLNIELVEIPFPNFPTNFLNLGPLGWSNYWKEQTR